MDWTMRKMPSVLAQLIFLILPSRAVKGRGYKLYPCRNSARDLAYALFLHIAFDHYSQSALQQYRRPKTTIHRYARCALSLCL